MIIIACFVDKPWNFVPFHAFKKKKIIYWLLWVFIAASRLSLVVASRGYSLVEVCRLLIAVASVAWHGPQ